MHTKRAGVTGPISYKTLLVAPPTCFLWNEWSYNADNAPKDMEETQGPASTDPGETKNHLSI